LAIWRPSTARRRSCARQRCSATLDSNPLISARVTGCIRKNSSLCRPQARITFDCTLPRFFQGSFQDSVGAKSAERSHPRCAEQQHCVSSKKDLLGDRADVLISVAYNRWHRMLVSSLCV
jgi:hypothetical protein